MAPFVQCRKCFELNDKGVSQCEFCGGDIGVQSSSATAVHIFPTGYWEHLALDPIYIKGREQLKSVCSDLGVRANILD